MVSTRIRLLVGSTALFCASGLCATSLYAPRVYAQEPPSTMQQPAQPAAITLSAGTLTITATNSSLRAILDDLQHRTGAKVSGLGSDQRIYGVYGPGNPQEVVSSLLDDSGYNYVISGRQADGAPREIELSAKGAAASAPTQPVALSQAAQDADENSEDTGTPASGFVPPTPTMPTATPHPGSGPSSGQPKTVQQMLEELQAMHQQQQAEQSNTPQ